MAALSWIPLWTAPSGGGRSLRSFPARKELCDDVRAVSGAVGGGVGACLDHAVIAKEPAEVTTADVFALWRAIRCHVGWRAAAPGVVVVAGWLVRTPRTLPRVLSPGDVDRLLGALRTRRDRAMVFAMLLGGLRRCEVLGLRLCDVNVGERRVHITCGKGGRERIVPVSGRFFGALGEYLELERPSEATTEVCFVVLKGPRRGLPLSPSGLDEVLDGARARAGLARCTCHQLRHTCLTRLREQGMALEAVQAQAGHASIESTRIYLHLSNDWLAAEYLAAAEAIDAQLDPLAGELAS
jgi:integrase